MPTVGRTLAAERARQRLDLEDIAARTKISLASLKAIENDDFERLPGLVFARSFVGQYADVVGLSKSALLEQFNREQSIAEPTFSLPEHDPEKIHVPGLRPPVLASVFNHNVISAFVTFLLTVVVCAAAFYAYQYWRERAGRESAVANTTAPSAPKSEAKAAQAPAPQKSAAAPAAAGTPDAGAAKPPESTEAEGQEQPPSESPKAAPQNGHLESPLVAATGANVRVVISATDACWTRITADGKVLFAGMLNAGDTREVNAASNVSLRAGNAGALKLILNGNDVAPLGPKGQIRIVTLTPGGAQVRTPTPEPVSEPL